MIQCAFLMLAMALTSACSAYNGIKKMEKNTEEMNQTTRDMNDTTRDMNDTTRNMNDTTRNMNETTRDLKSITESMRAKTSEMADDTDAMRRSTEALLRKTSELNQTIATMSSTTDAMREDMRATNRATDTLTHLSTELDNKTNDLYHDNRQGQSLELRLNSLRDMKNAKKQFAKMKYANFYYKAFEFQLWKNTASDDQTQLEYLQFQAAQEIIQTIDEIVPEGRRTLSPLSEKNYMQDLYALAAALHVVNNGATPPELANAADDELSMDILPESEDHVPQGMLALFYDALRQKKALASGTLDPAQLKPHQSAILKFEEIAVYILRLRVQFLTAIVVKQLSSPDGEHLGFFRRLGMLLIPWHPKTDNRNVVQLRYYGWVLGEAMATREFLAQQGFDSPLDGKLKQVVHHMRWSFRDDDEAATRNPYLKILEERFKALSE